MFSFGGTNKTKSKMFIVVELHIVSYILQLGILIVEGFKSSFIVRNKQLSLGCNEYPFEMASYESYC